MKRKPVELKPKFGASDLPGLVARFGAEQDDKALEAGRKIAGGDYGRDNFTTIVLWKTYGQGSFRLKDNEDDEISDALHLAVNAKTERSAIAVLCGLNGVGVPVASAVLTMINPERYTVIDFRALEALGTDTDDRTIDFYLIYLKACRNWASEFKSSLRDLDRALWQWSKDKADEANRQD